MLRANLIVVDRTATPGAIATKRPRIVYRLTEQGEQQFVTHMSEVGPTAWDDDNFNVRFAFFGRTDMEIRIRDLECRRMRLQERLYKVQSQLALTQKEMDQYDSDTQRHGVESAEREAGRRSALTNAEQCP